MELADSYQECACSLWQSPRWLLVNNRRGEALENLRLLRQGKRSKEKFAAEFQATEIALREEPEKGTFKEILQREIIRQTLIACGIICKHLSESLFPHVSTHTVCYRAVFQELSGQQITSKFGALMIKEVGGISPFIMLVEILTM